MLGLPERLFAAGNVWGRIASKKHVSTLWWRSGKVFDVLFHPRRWATWDWNKAGAKTAPPATGAIGALGSGGSLLLGSTQQPPNHGATPRRRR